MPSATAPLAGFPDASLRNPIILADGTPHAGTVFLEHVLDHPNIDVGAYSYYSDEDPPADVAGWAARLAPYLYPGAAEKLVIGRFCQIAQGTRFVTAGANHATRGITTFPFPVFSPERMTAYQPDRRDTIVGHDVWLGYGTLVAPGARIGSGAIVGAGSVVRGEIAPYSVVAGNPAKLIRMRFDADMIARLLGLAWWHWPPERIAAASAALQAADIDALEAMA